MKEKETRVTIIDLANELKRLAATVARDTKKNSQLSCLSNLTAMRPLHDLMMQVITADLEVESREISEKNPIGFVR